MRKLLKALWLSSMLAGCSASDPADRDAAPTSSRKYAELLPGGDDRDVVEGAVQVFFLPNDTRELTVQLLVAQGVPLTGEVVEFALLDSAAGASLDAQGATTDADGRASVRLTTGTTAANFTVRASHPSAEPLPFAVTVREARDPTMLVSVRYDGARPVVQRSVTVVPSMSCAEVLSQMAIGDKTYSLSEGADAASFAVGSGMRYAVAAWGRDSTGGRLSAGCVQTTTDVSAEDVVLDIEVALEDEALTFQGDFPIVADVPLNTLGQELSSALQKAARSVYAGKTADENSYYLEELRTRFVGLGGSSAEFDAARPSLLAVLTAHDDAQDFAPAYAAAIDARPAQVTIIGSLGVTNKTLLVSSAQSVDPGGTWSIDLLSPRTSVPIAGHFDSARAAFVVDDVSLPITLGAVIDSLQVGSALMTDRLASKVACAGFADALASNTDFSSVCDASCVASACHDAVDALVEAAASAFADGDSGSDSLHLSGELATHARDSNAIVDLGPSMLDATFGDTLTLPATVRSAVPRSSTL